MMARATWRGPCRRLAPTALVACFCASCPRAQAASDAPACPVPADFAAARGGLRELLTEMSARRGFELHYWRADSPQVTLQAGDEVTRMNAVASQANVIVAFESSASAPRPSAAAPPRRKAAPLRVAAAPCPERWQVREVWVLPAGAAQPAAAVRAAPAWRPPDAGTQAYIQAHERRPAGAASATASGASEP